MECAGHGASHRLIQQLCRRRLQDLTDVLLCELHKALTEIALTEIANRIVRRLAGGLQFYSDTDNLRPIETTTHMLEGQVFRSVGELRAY